MGEKVKVSKLTDPELCEAISSLREPKPTKKGYYVAAPDVKLDKSKRGNWEFVLTQWIALNWLAPENWTRLLDEMKEHLHQLWYTSGLKTWSINVWAGVMIIDIFNDRVSRAVSEHIYGCDWWEDTRGCRYCPVTWCLRNGLV